MPARIRAFFAKESRRRAARRLDPVSDYAAFIKEVNRVAREGL